MLLVSRFNLSLLVAFMVCFAIIAPASAKEAGSNPVAARVNGKPIYADELKPGMDEALARHRKNGAKTISDATKKRIQQQELDRQVGYELLVQAGEKMLGKEIEQKVDERMKSAQAHESKDGANIPAVSNLQNDKSRQQLRRQIIVDEYLALRGLGGLRVTEAEAKEYYEKNKQSFAESESVKVSHILVALPKDPVPEQVVQAKKEVERIRADILAGKEFAEAAKEHSACASAAAGGDLGYIYHGYMPKDFDATAFKLKVGEISDVVRTRHGFHLIKVYDKKPSRIQSFDEVKEFIERFLIKKVQAKKIDEIAGELRRQAKVEVYLN